jgi:uncharacterized membrane protein
MSLYETLLFFHVLGAFALVGGTVAMAPFALGVGAQAFERGDTAKLALIGSVLSGIGAVLTLVLGLWLVGNVGYSFFRFWILGALVLWAVAGYSNGEVAGTARALRKGEGGGERDVSKLWMADMLGATLLLVLMVWKPGH